jgi:Flp pilus assembly protein TadB
MKWHILKMIVGCGLPLLFIFFAPAMGLGSGISLLIFIVAMFACHLLMPMHHHGNQSNIKQKNSETYKTESNVPHH